MTVSMHQDDGPLAQEDTMPEIAGPQPAPAKKPKVEPKDLQDPTLRKDHQNEEWSYGKAGQDPKNRLFHRGVRATDVIQGSVADCYFVAALASVTAENPALIKSGIVDNGDNTYKVRFFTKENYWSSAYKETWVTIDGDLPQQRGNPDLRYAKGEKLASGGREIWPGLYEKAFAQLKGGYNVMGEGGSTAEAIEALSGKQVAYMGTDTTPDDLLWSRLINASKNNQAMAAGTRGKEDEALYQGTNLYAWHAYSILGAYEKGRGKDKKRFVKMRNPWGRVEPGQDGKDDGIFELTFEDFKKFYQNVNIANL